MASVLKWDPSLPLSNRRILLWLPPGRQAEEEACWKEPLAEKQMSNVEVFVLLLVNSLVWFEFEAKFDRF